MKRPPGSGSRATSPATRSSTPTRSSSGRRASPPRWMRSTRPGRPVTVPARCRRSPRACWTASASSGPRSSAASVSPSSRRPGSPCRSSCRSRPTPIPGRRSGIPAVLTSRDHPSGTDRVWEVAQTRAADVYVNIQGDEPLLTSGHVARLVEPFLARPETQVSTLCIVATAEEIASPSVNKVVFGPGGRALYFAKFGIPFDRDGRGVIRYKHVGLYAYRKAALDRFHALPPSILEQSEGLEQLRFLE